MSILRSTTRELPRPSAVIVNYNTIHLVKGFLGKSLENVASTALCNLFRVDGELERYLATLSSAWKEGGNPDTRPTRHLLTLSWSTSIERRVSLNRAPCSRSERTGELVLHQALSISSGTMGGTIGRPSASHLFWEETSRILLGLFSPDRSGRGASSCRSDS